MKISRVEKEEKNMKIKIDGEEIEQVTEFCYLGSLISRDYTCRDIKKRMVKALIIYGVSRYTDRRRGR